MNTKKPELTAEKEKLILDAAQRRFISYGYSKVTMDEIAEDIGMGKASLYYYFPTKDDILRGVIQREQEEYVQGMNEMLKTRVPYLEKIRFYVRLRIKFSGEILSLSWHNRQIWPSMKPIFRDLFQSLSAKEQSVLAKLLRDGKKNKEFSLASPERTARMILNVIQGLRIRMFYIEHNGASMESIHGDLANDTQMFIDIILNGIQNRSGN